MLGLGMDARPYNQVIARDVRSCTYCCYVRCATLIVRVGGMPWPKTGATIYQAQLGLPDNGRAIKGLVVCYVVWLGSIEWVCEPAQGAWV